MITIRELATVNRRAALPLCGMATAGPVHRPLTHVPPPPPRRPVTSVPGIRLSPPAPAGRSWLGAPTRRAPNTKDLTCCTTT